MNPLFPGSIHARLLLAASVVLAAFLGVTGFSLDKAFRSSSEKALKASLQSRVYAILAAAIEDEEGRFSLPEILTDPGFNLPDSGLYAEVSSPRAGFHWRSASSVGRSLKFLQPVAQGMGRYQFVELAGGGGLMAYSFGVSWEDDYGNETNYVLAVAEDLESHLEQVGAFRDSLLLWLGGAALLLLLAQGWVLRWGLQPLRSVARELRLIESGQSDQLSGDYPRELTGLTRNVNSLIRHAQARQQRYRDSLGDLAHSLKTPLAILQNLADQERNLADGQSQPLSEQVTRMNQIVSHQLQRAAASGRTTLMQNLPLRPAAERIARSLAKVYQEKGIVWEISMDEKVGFPGDEGDLMEVLGNLMDNAWKYAGTRVRVSGEIYRQGMAVHVEDDGAGIPPVLARQVLKRGQRIDEQQPGQGIGLAVVEDIVTAYGGELKIGKSDLGGADVSVLIAKGS